MIFSAKLASSTRQSRKLLHASARYANTARHSLHPKFHRVLLFCQNVSFVEHDEDEEDGEDEWVPSGSDDDDEEDTVAETKVSKAAFIAGENSEGSLGCSD